MSGSVIKSESEARELGSECNATLVIWGWYDKLGATPHYEVIKSAGQIKQVELVESPGQVSEPTNFDFFVRQELPQGMLHLTSFTIGQIHHLAGQHTEALVCFTEALSALPEGRNSPWGEAYVYFYRGITQANLRQWPLAIEDYERALQANDQLTEAYNNLGIAYANQGDYDNAIKNFDLAISLGFDIAYYNRGNAHRHRGELDSAINDYREASTRVREYAYAAYYNLGLTYAQARRHREAVEAYGEAIAQEAETYPDFYQARARSYFVLGEYTMALADLTTVIEELDTNQQTKVEAYTNRGVVHTHLRQYAEALVDYQKALDLDSDYAIAHYNMGATKALTGDGDGAVEALTVAVSLDPCLAYDAACDPDFASIRKRTELQGLIPWLEECPPAPCP